MISFHRALKEVITQGLVKADLKARVIFIGNAIKYNNPPSPNVARSWAVHWDGTPECPLKNKAYQTPQYFVQGLGKAFSQACDESLRKTPLKKQSHQTKPLLNQEQEQEQEQDDESKERELSSNIYWLSFYSPCFSNKDVNKNELIASHRRNQVFPVKNTYHKKNS